MKCFSYFRIQLKIKATTILTRTKTIVRMRNVCVRTYVHIHTYGKSDQARLSERDNSFGTEIIFLNRKISRDFDLCFASESNGTLKCAIAHCIAIVAPQFCVSLKFWICLVVTAVIVISAQFTTNDKKSMVVMDFTHRRTNELLLHNVIRCRRLFSRLVKQSWVDHITFCMKSHFHRPQ